MDPQKGSLQNPCNYGEKRTMSFHRPNTWSFRNLQIETEKAQVFIQHIQLT